jgi:SAM-dependent methyltransferase
LCGAGQFEVLSRLDRRLQPLVTEVCRRCGLVSHQEIPTEEALAEFYATDYRREYHGEITPSPRRVMRAWRNGQRILHRALPFLSPRSRVLEVGAGIGCTVKAFEQHGHDASGIEPNDGFQAYSHERLRADVSKAYLFELPPLAENDLVLLVHVIEHFRSPRAALEHLHKLIKPGGLLYVECPNLGAIATRENTFHFAHIHNFTPTTLATMARFAGFEGVHWFSNADSPVLRVLLRRVEDVDRRVPADSYQQTLAAYRRYGFWSYHLRPTYLSARAAEVLDKAWERIAAPHYVRRVLARCANSPPIERHLENTPRARRAA